MKDISAKIHALSLKVDKILKLVAWVSDALKKFPEGF